MLPASIKPLNLTGGTGYSFSTVFSMINKLAVKQEDISTINFA